LSLLLGLGPGVSRVRVSFRIVLRLSARKFLDMDGSTELWCASGALIWVSLGVVCAGRLGCVLWLGVLLRFARGHGGGVIIPFSRACFCGMSLGYALGGEVWGLVGEVRVIGTSRNFVSSSLLPCSSRISEALWGVGVHWMMPS